MLRAYTFWSFVFGFFCLRAQDGLVAGSDDAAAFDAGTSHRCVPVLSMDLGCSSPSQRPGYGGLFRFIAGCSFVPFV